MSEVDVWDLKSGSGQITRLGDTLELRFQVASSLANLDAGVLLQSNWVPGESALYATLGAGHLRTAIDAGLTGVPVGTNRRFRVPAGVWPDVKTLLVIGIDVGGIVPATVADRANWTFDEMASAVPLAELERDEHLDDEICALLERALAGLPRGGTQRIVRLRVPLEVHSHLRTHLDERGLAATLRYRVHEVGTVPGGDYELEVAVEDAKTLLRLLRRGD